MPVIRPDVWVHAPGGPLAAAVASFNVTADKKGSIALTWTASVDQAIVGGLELYHTGKGSPPKLPADISKSAVPPPLHHPIVPSTSALRAYRQQLLGLSFLQVSLALLVRRDIAILHTRLRSSSTDEVQASAELLV